MRNYLIPFVIGVLLFAFQLKGQTFQSQVAQTACSIDTIEYLWTKTSAVNSVEISEGATRRKLGQAYHPLQTVDVHGFSFYAYLNESSASNDTLKAKIYTLNSNGLPDQALDSVKVSVDTTETVRQVVNFSSPITVTDSFAITVEATSSKSFQVYTNDQGDANKENKGLIYFGPPFSSWQHLLGNDIDVLLFPFISYNLTTDYKPSDRNICHGDTVSFTNLSSPVLDNKTFNSYNEYPMNCPKNLTTSLSNGGSLTADTVYRYKITAVDDSGRETEACTHQTDTTGPSDKTIVLNWDSVYGAAAYKVYRELKGDTLTYTTTTNTSFTDNGTTPFNPTSYNDTTLYTAAMANHTPRYPIAEDTLRGDATGSKIPIDSLSWSFIPQQINTGYSYTWKNNGQFLSHQKDISHIFSTIGKYTVTLNDTINGWHIYCQGQEDTLITSSPLADLTRDTSICERDSAQLKAEGGITYRWSPATGLSDTSAPDPMAGPSDTTTYTVTITDINGCSIDTNVTVQVQGIPQADFGYQIDSLTVSFFDSSKAGDKYFWRFDDGNVEPNVKNPTHTYAGEGNYNVQLSVESRCGTDIDTQLVVVRLDNIIKTQDNYKINTYPQPASRSLSLRVTDQPINDAYLRIYNLQGETVYRLHRSHLAKGEILRLPVNQLPSGQYTLLIQATEGRFTQQFSVQHP